MKTIFHRFRVGIKQSIKFIPIFLSNFLVSGWIGATPAPISAKVLVNGINMYYELHGRGDPIVLIAGFSCDHTFWSGVLGELAKHHQVLVFDNRGVGQTDSPDSPYSIDMMADDVMGLTASLGIKNPTIVGQSMGSAVAQTIAKRYPKDINNIILMNTFYQLNKNTEIAFESVGSLQRINVPIKYRTYSIAPWVFSSEFLSQPNQMTNLVELAENNPYPQTLIGYERQLGALKLFHSHSWLHEINVPVLVIAGEQDLISPPSEAREVANQIAHHTQFLIVPGGHASPVEQPAKVEQAILSFVRSVKS